MNPPNKDHVQKVLQDHRQFPGDYCAVSALEFVSKIYGLLPTDKFPLQSNSANQAKGFDEIGLQNLVYLEGKAELYDIQSAVDLTEREMNEGRCPLVSLRAFVVFDQILIPAGYHILVAILKEGRPTLIDPATKQVLAQGKESLTNALQWNSDHNRQRSTIHIQTLYPKTE